MTPKTLRLPAGKAEFNFDEAAAALGISSTELIHLVEAQLGSARTDQKALSRLRFRPADLIMLNFSRQQSSLANALD